MLFLNASPPQLHEHTFVGRRKLEISEPISPGIWDFVHHIRQVGEVQMIGDGDLSTGYLHAKYPRPPPEVLIVLAWGHVVIKHMLQW